MIGQIVLSKAGRDCGTFLVTVGETETDLLVCDGKKRRLEQPKRKRKRHVAVTQTLLSAQQISTNKSIRRSLAVFRDSAALKEEAQCQNRI